MRLPRLTRSRRWFIAVSVTAILLGAVFRDLGQRRAKAAAERLEARVRELLRDEPLSNLCLHPARDGFTYLLYLAGVRRPYERRGEKALVTINPIDRVKGLTRSASQTIALCRKVPVGVPAELYLSRKVPAPNPLTLLGPYSSSSRSDIGMIKDVAIYTYGGLDVGIKDGAIVVVRVR